MRILILGATGCIGGPAVHSALAAGHDVVAIVPQPDRLPARAGLCIIEGDVRAADVDDAAVRNMDAVIAALGPRMITPDDEQAVELGMRNVVAAMERHATGRLVALSGAGIDVPVDRKPFVDRIMSHLVRRFGRHVLARSSASSRSSRRPASPGPPCGRHSSSTARRAATGSTSLCARAPA